MRALERNMSKPHADEVIKGNVRLGPDYVDVSEERAHLPAHLIRILHVLIESRHRVPSAVLMRQVGIARENTLHSYMSTLRKETGLRIPGTSDGYYIDFENG